MNSDIPVIKFQNLNWVSLITAWSWSLKLRLKLQFLLGGMLFQLQHPLFKKINFIWNEWNNLLLEWKFSLHRPILYMYPYLVVLVGGSRWHIMWNFFLSSYSGKTGYKHDSQLWSTTSCSSWSVATCSGTWWRGEHFLILFIIVWCHSSEPHNVALRSQGIGIKLVSKMHVAK